MADMMEEGRVKLAERDLLGEMAKVVAEAEALEVARERLRDVEGE